MPEDDFRDLIARGPGFKEVLGHFGMRNVGGNHRTLKKRVEFLGVSVEHLHAHAREVRSQVGSRLKRPLKEILVKGSTFSSFHLKRRLLAEGVLENICSECEQGPEWHGSVLVLQLDHINGEPDDNRRKNLRLLCPNCHSQTRTFAGRNR